ncbi:hypothetical protein [Asanoa iriomotensis]|uniref:Uncharacterized protein n=1 Tax=Asanoa iriomotensis TaxID=234613 RepID=A0ABQ4BWE2_9ACTN|nr:hypothetical protein [Asanoa iriomotensis]GIF54853.1 hypothetical protein Air01nite_09480 [Asanoa iriomotensis]
MIRRLSGATVVLVPLTALVLLPIATNVASDTIPASWRPYTWIAWLFLLVATATAVFRRLRSRPADLIYASRLDESPYADWTFFASKGVRESVFEVVTTATGSVALGFHTPGDEAVGANKALQTTKGYVEFRYKIDSAGGAGFVYFAMIPMRDNGLERRGLIEVGAEVQADARNPTSIYRQRLFPPHSHYGDGQWHQGRLAFDFTNLPAAYYAIFAPRINEGIERTGAARVWIADVEAHRT